MIVKVKIIIKKVYYQPLIYQPTSFKNHLSSVHLPLFQLISCAPKMLLSRKASNLLSFLSRFGFKIEEQSGRSEKSLQVYFEIRVAL